MIMIGKSIRQMWVNLKKVELLSALTMSSTMSDSSEWLLLASVPS